jgi:hypothetical protein
MNMVGLIAFGVILLLLIAIILLPWLAGAQLIEWVVRDGHRRYSRLRVSDAYSSLRTGDIVLFATHASMIPIFTRSQFTHAGMVVRRRCGGCPPDCIDCEVLIAEATGGVPDGQLAVGYQLPAGVSLSPLLPRLKLYPGGTYLMRLATPLPPGAEAVLATAAASRVGRPFAPPLQLINAVLRGAPADHCFGLVGELLGTIGLQRAPAAPGGAPAPLCAAGAIGVQRAICALGEVGDAAHLVATDGAAVLYRPTVELVYDIDC